LHEPFSLFAGDTIGTDDGVNQAKPSRALNSRERTSIAFFLREDRHLPGRRQRDPSTLWVLDDSTLSCPSSLGDNVLSNLKQYLVLQRFAFINTETLWRRATLKSRFLIFGSALRPIRPGLRV